MSIESNIARAKDLTGQVFGKWLAIERVGRNKYGMGIWLCECECGKKKDVLQGSLTAGTSISCGCGNNTRKTKHGYLKGGAYPKEYSCWRNMINRCYDKKHRSYVNYGARGIAICERWRYSFENFMLDMGNMPSPKHSLDRYPDKNGNYEPGNCRWATLKQQFENMNKNVWTVFRGEKMIAAEFRRVTGIESHWTSELLKTKTGDEVYDLYKKRGII